MSVSSTSFMLPYCSFDWQSLFAAAASTTKRQKYSSRGFYLKWITLNDNICISCSLSHTRRNVLQTYLAFRRQEQGTSV